VLRFCSLGSGSEGNALVVEAGDDLHRNRVLVDNGFSPRQLERRLAAAGLAPHDLDAICVTHEHSDHVSGVTAFARRHALPIYASAGTAEAACLHEPDLVVQVLTSGCMQVIGTLQIEPYAVPHDAAEPTQFVFSDGARRFGLLTDIGEPTLDVIAALGALDALMLECNHDAALLAASAYPPFLKARIAGELGHLSNDQAAQLLAALPRERLRVVVAAHLSRRNNTAELARAALAQVLGAAPDEVDVADQDRGITWRCA
jgi:phosphoribosyl 1,2-cyclic phosphodiesterase